ncbi:angiotensin-converting enzyme 2-like [Ptychodera flava]|uniref:angiotensin-converting enzyme 2-like n=1 Tax=Ptychodera flava TaxID=63121 RepID=UPI00396A4E31
MANLTLVSSSTWLVYISSFSVFGRLRHSNVRIRSCKIMAGMRFSLFALVLFCACLYDVSAAELNGSGEKTEDQAQEFLDYYNEQAQIVFPSYVHAYWDYSTNLTQHNLDIMQEEGLKVAAFSQEAYQNASVFTPYMDNYSDIVARELGYIANIGYSILETDDYEKLQGVLANMSLTYAMGQVCFPWDENRCELLDPVLTDIMANSRNYSERLWVWKHWRDDVGRKLRPVYVDYVELTNKAAVMNGYEDHGDNWRADYEDDNLEEDMWHMYADILPLYQKLHAYVRYRLKDVYGDKINRDNGCLPANVLGDMWGRFWTNLYSLVEPYENGTDVDVTDELIKQGYTPHTMTELADNFFVSMGMIPAPQEFWDHSMLERPDDGRDVECHATAWDFYNQIDFRIRMCSQVNMDDLLTLYHEMGHIQYFLQYKEQPVSFRDGANEGFHEAVGEVVALSAATPQHLYDVGLLHELADDYESDINFLMKQALTMVATLPFSMALEKWRWEVFRENIPYEEWTKRWWETKHKFVGVVEPYPRTEVDLDPPALYHVANDFSFLRYYTRTFIQFQFYEALCEAAGWDRELYKCDFYNSTAAGKLLGDMLEKGKSEPWPEAMMAIAGTEKMESGPFLNYFEPLDKWLNRELKDLGLIGEIGWDQDCTWRPYDEEDEPTDEPADPVTEPVSAGFMNSATKLCLVLAAIFAFCTR